MFKKLFLSLARACYALVVVGASVFGVYLGVDVVAASAAPVSARTAAAMISFILLFLVSRALTRKWRRGALIPQTNNHRQSLLVFVMTAFGAAAHFLVSCVCLALYQYRYVYPGREVEGGPMLFFLMIATGCYIIAMLIGELHPDNVSTASRG